MSDNNDDQDDIAVKPGDASYASDSAGLVRLAHAYGVTGAKALPVSWGWRGVVVRTMGDIQVVVMRLGFNWRVAELDIHGNPNGRYWCYPAYHAQAFRAALINAFSYGDGEPDGWVKAWGDRHA